MSGVAAGDMYDILSVIDANERRSGRRTGGSKNRKSCEVEVNPGSVIRID